MNVFSYANTSLNYQPERYIHPCPHCSQIFASPHNVEQHCREQHNYPGARCPECQKEFARNWLMYRHMKRVHGINIHPGQGRQPPGATRRRRPRRAVGPRAPIATRPQALPIRDAQRSPQTLLLRQEPQTPQVIAEPYVILGWHDEERQEDAEVGVEVFDQVMGAQEAFEAPAYDQSFYERVSNWLVCPHLTCPSVFDNQETLLGHLHAAHSLPYSEYCECIECFLKQITDEFPQAGGEFPFAGEVPLSPTPTPMAGLETYAGDNEMDMDDDSGIDRNSVKSPSIEQRLSYNNQPVLQLNAEDNEVATSNVPEPIAGDQGKRFLEAGEVNAAFDQTDFDFGLGFLDDVTLAWLEGQAGQFIGGWDDDGL